MLKDRLIVFNINKHRYKELYNGLKDVIQVKLGENKLDLLKGKCESNCKFPNCKMNRRNGFKNKPYSFFL